MKLTKTAIRAFASLWIAANSACLDAQMSPTLSASTFEPVSESGVAKASAQPTPSQPPEDTMLSSSTRAAQEPVVARNEYPPANPTVVRRPPLPRMQSNEALAITDLRTALLSPQPKWHPLAEESLQPTERGRVEVPKQSSTLQAHLENLQRRALELLPDAQLVSDVDWLAARGDHCVGFADITTTLEADASGSRGMQVVLKQAGPFDAQTPDPLFMQERAWLAAMAQQPRSPKLLAQCPKSSLLVMERVQGDTMPPLYFTEERRSWVAKALATVHAVPLTDDMLKVRGERQFPWSVERWLPFVHHLGLVDDAKYWKLFTLRDLIAKSLDELPAVRTGIHGDAMPGNLLVDSDAKQVIPIDYEYACLGDPMYDLAFFAVSIHLPMQDALSMVEPYNRAQRQLGLANDPSNEKRLSLYITYQRLFRHVASHKEYKPGEEVQFDRWLFQLHEDVAYLQKNGLLQRSILAPETEAQSVDNAELAPMVQ